MASRRGIALRDKYRVVRAVRGGQPQAQVARQLGLSKSTVSGIWKNRQAVLRAYEEHRPAAKRLRPSSNDAVDRALFTWFRAQVNAGQVVGGPILRRKAEEIAKKLGDDKFTCSLGWMDRFKVRHSISFTKIKEVTAESDKKNYEHKFWPDVKGDFKERDIFVVKETGLYYGAGPEEATLLAGKVCDGGEDADERITVCLCANMTGTEKRRLLVVGNKCQNGRSYPVKYKANRKSWVDMNISGEELTAWEEELSADGRRVLLLVQYSPAFRTFGDLAHVTLGYLPSSMDGHPLDRIVITLKENYRKYVLKRLYLGGDDTNISLSESLEILAKAWCRITEKSIADGFRILHEGKPPTEKSDSFIYWVSKQAFAKSIDMIKIKRYIDFDENLVTSVHFTSDAADTRESLECSTSVSSKELKDNSPTPEEAREALKVLYKFFEESPNSCDILNHITSVAVALEEFSETNAYS